MLRAIGSSQWRDNQNLQFSVSARDSLKMLLICTVAMEDSTQTPNSNGWTKSDVLALLALAIGFPAAIVAVIVIPAVWKRHCCRRRGESPTFTVSVSVSEILWLAK